MDGELSDGSDGGLALTGRFDPDSAIDFRRQQPTPPIAMTSAAPSPSPLPQVAEPVAPDPRARSGGKDVARLAGVSTATVSRALNSPDRVDPQTRRRVLEAVAKLRYVPHGAARSLRSRRSKMIGAVVPSFDYALYARTTSALQAVLDGRATRWCSPSTTTTSRPRYGCTAADPARRRCVRLRRSRAMIRPCSRCSTSYGRPYVLTWGVDPLYRHPSIGFDNHAATFAMTRHLIGLGHRRIGLLSARAVRQRPGDGARCRHAAGARRERAWRLPTSACNTGRSPRAAASGMKQMLALPRSGQPRWSATNDVFAVGAMIACRRPVSGSRRTSRSPASTTPTSEPRRRRASPASARRSSRSAAPPPRRWSRGSKATPPRRTRHCLSS